MHLTYLKISDGSFEQDYYGVRFDNMIDYIKYRCSSYKKPNGDVSYYISVGQLAANDRRINVSALVKEGKTEAEALQYRWDLDFTDDSILVVQFVGHNPLRASEIARKFRCRLAVEERFTSSNRIHTYYVERGGRITNLRIFEHEPDSPETIIMEVAPSHEHKPRDLCCGSEERLVWANPFLKKTA